MSNYETTAIAFETYTIREGSYDHTYVRIFQCYVQDVAEEFEGTVDNKAGYGDAEAAKRVGIELQALMDGGHQTHYQSTTSQSLNCHIDFQHYQHNGSERLFCSPSFNLGGSFREHEEGMKLLKRLGRKLEKMRGNDGRNVGNWTFDVGPDKIMEALRSMRGLIEVDVAGTRSHYLVQKTA